MNYLAHLWLTEHAGLPLPGAVLGDLVHGRLDGRFASALERSIALHRRIDVVTDAHPLVVAARTEFGPGARRYAGIVLDLLHDHALALDWSEFSEESLEAFAQRSAQALAAEHTGFALAGKDAPPQDEFRRLLLSYATGAGMDRAVCRVASWLRKPEGLIGAAEGWRERLAAARQRLPLLLEDLRRAAVEFAGEGVQRP
jgi:acyl carrier protein phosphodiesterase